MSENMRVAGYGRVSTQSQAREGTSPEEQRRVIEAECEKNGWTLVKFYMDDGFSGKNDNRPGWQQLLRDAKDGKFKMVMFTKLDRVGRNMRDLLNIWHTLYEDNMLDIYCVQQPEANTKSPLGKMMLAILGIFAEWERDIIKERTDSGRKERWRRNQSIMGSLPMGYKFDSGEKGSRTIIVDEDKKAVYESIVFMYLSERMSTVDIAHRLNDAGVASPGRYGAKWNNVTVSKILKNEAYTGEKYYNKTKSQVRTAKCSGKQYFAHTKVEKERKEWIRVTYPPLITRSLFNEIQELMKSKVNRPKRKRSGTDGHFLLENGLLHCGECGGRMKTVTLSDGTFRYQCYWNWASEKERPLHGKSKCDFKVDSDWLDRYVLQEVTKAVSSPGLFATSWLKDPNLKDTERRRDQLRARKEADERTLGRLYERLNTTEGAAVMTLDSKIKEVERRVNETARDLERVEREYDLIQNKQDRLAEFERAWATATVRQSFNLQFGHERKVADYINSLSFKEQKRLVETVLSPETGGNVTARYFVPMLDVGCDERLLSEEEKARLWQPVKDECPIVEIEFLADINKIEYLISGMDRSAILDKAIAR